MLISISSAQIFSRAPMKTLFKNHAIRRCGLWMLVELAFIGDPTSPTRHNTLEN